MNRWTHPVQYLQQAVDRHTAYIKELQKLTSDLREKIEMLERNKANKQGRKKTKLEVIN